MIKWARDGRKLNREAARRYRNIFIRPASDEDRQRWYLLTRAGLNYFETLFYARERGEVPNEIWESRILRMRQLASRGLREGWDAHRRFYGAGFVDFFETQVLAVDFVPNEIWEEVSA